jgi:hypothetical protein
MHSSLVLQAYLEQSGLDPDSTRLTSILDWWLLGEFGFIASCGTTFSVTAIGRRASLPLRVVVHEHVLEDFPSVANLTGYVWKLLPSTSWTGCRVVEVLGERWRTH